MNPLNVYAYDILSKALEIAFNEREITIDDLLKNSNFQEVRDLIKSINSQVK